jgi:hypothetical protein
MMGRPARTSASNSWLKRRKRSVVMAFFIGRSSRSEKAPRFTSKTYMPCRRRSSCAARTLLART